MSWLDVRRDAARARFEALAPPALSDERWKYSPVFDLDVEAFAQVSEAPPAADHMPPELESVLAAAGELAGCVFVHDGFVVRAELDATVADSGVTVGSGGDVGAVTDAIGDPADWFVAMHEARMADAAVIDIPDGVVVEKPIAVFQWVGAEGSAVFPHLVVRCGVQSEVTVLEFRASADVAALAVNVTELDAGDGAHLRYLGVQDLERRVWEIGTLASRTGRDAVIRSQVVALGGAYARADVRAAVSGDGSETDISAVYFGDGEQIHDFRSVQDHTAVKGKSNFLLKGAAAGTARGIYSGVITIHQGSKGTDAFLTNRNLVLSEGAGIDSIPNLEIINENDLRNCGHAAATGPVDDEQLFYLESRGIPTDVAERLIVFGFFDEVVAAVPVPGWRELLRQAVAVKLAAVR